MLTSVVGAPVDADRLALMGDAYRSLLADREALMLQMQLYAACGDPQVRQAVSRRYAALYELVMRVSGADAESVREFFAAGMLLNVVAAMGVAADLGQSEWFEHCLHGIE
jgi:hypothetical protein